MGQLTTHVLDTTAGTPAAGLTVELWGRRGENGSWRQLRTALTNADGRVDGPMLEGDSMLAGQYELRFHAGAYLRTSGNMLPEPAFLDIVPIRFGIADVSAHYHVPLLLSAYGYSTYRGS